MRFYGTTFDGERVTQAPKNRSTPEEYRILSAREVSILLNEQQEEIRRLKVALKLADGLADFPCDVAA